MLATLLAERFKLKLHKSSKEMPGYALEVGKGGPKVKAAADGQEHPDTFRFGSTGLSGQGITMRDLARFVAGKLGLVGVDQTGLKGVYDFKVEWRVETGSGDDPREALRDAVIAALRDQLGLKLAAGKVTVPMLVIDSVERASASDN
jgi:uncharacterized protein (TIGR03435 family)